ncbi:MAG TPA: hypothetical protein VII59_13665 [Streptosporangiaceae bacterium]
MEIRVATAEDWPSIYPFYSTIMDGGRTYAFPEGQTLEEARPWWMEQPPGRTVVAVNDPAVHLWKSLGLEVIGTVPESFDHPDHGLVGLHVMHRRL